MTDRTSRTNVADAVVRHMIAMGIRAAFGIPGGAVSALYYALSRASALGRIRLVTARHEAGAGFMAYGWWLETGEPAAVVTTTGPGAVNAVSGIACANVERAPILVLTGQVATPKQGRNALQESSSLSGVDTVAMYASCTALSAHVTHASQLPAAFAAAYARMHGDPKGPAHLSIATDVLEAEHPPEAVAPSYEGLAARPAAVAGPELIVRAAAFLDAAHDPVVLLGDASASGMAEALAIAEKLRAPICASPSVAGSAADRHPLFQGRFGFGGHASARDCVARADALLLVATTGGECEASAWGPHVPKCIHVADTPDCLRRTPEAKMRVLGDLKTTLAAIGARLKRRRGPNRPSRWSPPAIGSHADAPVAPQALMRALGERLPHGSSVYVDAGNAAAWIIHHLPAEGARGRLRLSLNYASMGWVIGAAVGGALASRRPTVALVGDGAMLMAGQEFSVAVRENLPCVFVVLNDSSLGMVRHGQRLGGGSGIDTDLPKTDFAAMARAMGGHGISADDARTLAAVDWDALFARKGPSLVDVRIDPDQEPPMHARVTALAKEQTGWK